MKKITLTLIVLLISLSSCSVQKRRVDPYIDSIFKADIFPLCIERLNTEGDKPNKLINPFGTTLNFTESLSRCDLIQIHSCWDYAANPYTSKKKYYDLLKWYSKYKYHLTKELWHTLDSLNRRWYTMDPLAEVDSTEIWQHRYVDFRENFYKTLQE